MDSNQQTLILGALIVGIGLIINAISRGASIYIVALANAKAKAVAVDVDDTERKNRLDARDRELIQVTYSKQADELREQRTMIANLEAQFAVTDHINAKLEEQQKINVERIAQITKEFEEYRKERHDADNLIAQKLAASETRAIQAEQARDEAIAALQKCLDRAGNVPNGT